MSEIAPGGKVMATLLGFQRNEITEHRIYLGIAAATRESQNRSVLEQIAAQELEHYHIWKNYTNRDVAPETIRVWYYQVLARLFGMTFAIKLMERIEKRAQEDYHLVGEIVPEVRDMVSHEESHEQELIKLLDEERLRYVGSVVLGLSDALVEFTGSLAGFTFALQDTRIIAMTGFIMGVAATLSMAASEYLSRRSEIADGTDPIKASGYTGAAYIMTVILLVTPFLLLANPYYALTVTLATAVTIIALFSFYISVAKDLPFRQRFAEMAMLSLGIAAISFGIGIIIRTALGVTV